MAKLLVMRGLLDWFTSPIESAKNAYNDAVAKWQAALTALDAAVADFNTINPDDLQDDPALLEQYNTASSHLNLFQSTLDEVNSARQTIVGWFGSNGSTNTQQMGALPVLAWIAIITAAIAAAWALVNELRQVYATYTNAQIAKGNLDLASQNKAQVPYIDLGSPGGGILGDTPALVKWGAIAFALYIGYEIYKTEKRT